MNIKSEQLAYWYLRLNGFFTITNFIIHPDQGNKQETDVDVLGVRFPYRAENLLNPMMDDVVFTRYLDKSYIVMAEVKSRVCALNGPWTKRERQNMLRVLRAIGAFPEEDSNRIAQALYDAGHYENILYHVSLLCLGGERSSQVAERYPNIPQILWNEVLGFIYRRFREYRAQKVSHPQWDARGHALWKAARESRSEEQFKAGIQVL